MSRFNPWCRTFILVCNQPPRSTQPGHLFVGRQNEYKPQDDDALRLGGKAGMVCVWSAGQTVWFPSYTWVISEHLYIKHYINSSVYFLLYYVFYLSLSVICHWLHFDAWCRSCRSVCILCKYCQSHLISFDIFFADMNCNLPLWYS